MSAILPAATFGKLKSTPRKKPKKRSVSTAKNAAWGWFSKYIRAKAAASDGLAECVTCGVRKPWKDLHAGHFIPKKRGLAVYFMEENVHPQCPQCNTFNGGMLIEYSRFIAAVYGQDMIEQLLEASRFTVRYRLADYESFEQEYKAKFQEL